MEKKIDISNYSTIINRAGTTISDTKRKIIPIKSNGNKLIRPRVKGPEVRIHEVNHQNRDINPGPVLQHLSRNTSSTSSSLQNYRNLANHSHLQNDESLSLQSFNNPLSTVQNGPARKNQHDDVTEQSREKGYLENLDPQQQQHSPIHYPLSPNVIICPRSNENPSDSSRSTSHQEVTKNIPRVLQQTSPNEENFPTITKLSTDSEEKAENILIKELNDILNNINTTIAPLYESMSSIRKAFFEYAQRFQRAVNDVDNYCELKLKEVTEVNKQQTELTISEDTSTRDNDHRNRNYDNSDEHVKITKQSSSFVLPPDYEPNQEIFTKESSYENSNSPNHDERSVGSECNPQHALTDEHPITTKMSVDSNGMVENIFINEFNNILNNIDITLARKHESMITIHKAFSDYTKTFEKVITDVNSYCELSVKEVTTSNKQQTKSAISSLPEGTSAARDKDQQNRKNKDNPDVEDVKPTKKRRLFVLPSDYEPNDTRWTLRHRKPGPGLVELIPKSNIYVNKNRLYHCCTVARNCNVLARMLLQIVFSSNALSVCSLTDARGNGYKLVGSDIRPGLDKYARTILLTFVKEHGVSKGWQVPDTQTIVNSIRYKLKEIRKKPFLFC